MTIATAHPIHPTHLADLRKSGLSDATITQAGLYTARPHDLARLCGRQVPNGTSGLVIPYATDFQRVKFFPPITSRDGKQIKYGQPPGSGVRAYVPRGALRLLDDAEVPLFIAEGEKKALKLMQEGFPAVGLGGIWNFRTRDLPPDRLIADLELIAWKGRIVRLVPDSDAWEKDQVLYAIYVLARLLEARGATVLIVKLPTLEGHDKTGSDDFLVAKGIQAFRRLVDRAVTLGHPAFKAFRERQKRADREAKQQTAEPIVEETIPWDEPVDGEELLLTIDRALQRYVILPTMHARVAIAVWVIAAHALESFWIFPMLGITSPTRRCGKTTLLDMLRTMTPRPLPAANITAPSVFRTIQVCTPCLLIDEADSFTEKNEEMRGVINSGHTRGMAFVVRLVEEGGQYVPKRFSTWCPKVIAQIGKLFSTWEDRSIVIPMRRKAKSEQTAKLKRKALGSLGDFGRQAARWAKDHLEALAAAEPKMPEALDDRAADNWEPLLAVAECIGRAWPERVKAAALALSGDRDAEDETLGIRLLRNIRQIFNRRAKEDRKYTDPDRIASKDLMDALLKEAEWGWAAAFKGDPLTQQNLASTLRPFGVRPKSLRPDKDSTTSFRGYERKAFIDPWNRYLPPEEASDPKRSKQASDSEDLGQESDLKHGQPVLDPDSAVTPQKQEDVLDVLDETPPEGEGDGIDDLPEPESTAQEWLCPQCGQFDAFSMEAGQPVCLRCAAVEIFAEHGNGSGTGEPREDRDEIPDAELSDAEFCRRHGCSLEDLRL